MDVIYDRQIFNELSKEYFMDSNDLAYIKKMSQCMTNVSYDIFSRINLKSVDLKINDVLETAKAIKNIKPVTISAIIICSNEERIIERCITSIQHSEFDEIIVIDTGSTDKTIEILKSLQCYIPCLQVCNTIWEDDFSKVRNLGISLAKSEWVFFIDADEYYVNEDDCSIKEIISFYNIYYDGKVGLCPNIINYNKHELYNNPRIFKKDSGYMYYGNVHETLREKKDSYEFVSNIGLNIKFGHDGYKPDVYREKNKEDRNINLLMKCIEKEPDNPLWKCYLARDGIRKLSSDIIIKNCKAAIALCEDNKEYLYNYYWAHFILVDFYINAKDADNARILLNNIKQNNINLDESDIYYREQLISILEIEKDLDDKLKDVKKYRENHLSTKGSSLNTKGYHLDELIMRLNYLKHNMSEFQRYRDILYELGYLE